MKKFLFLLIVLCFAATSHATIINETGTLRGFVLGQCPNCAYQNWVSHISEGIARAGYNDYGPAWFDPQLTGFGSFTLIPTGAQGDTTLARWRSVFLSAIEENWNNVDAILVANQASWRYQLVRLTDNELQRTFYILREVLDMSYNDPNVASDPADDVAGSFRNGWGLFVFNTTPLMNKIVIQMPHPEDDFISLPVGLEMFIHFDARVLMIAGAGREIRWESTNPPYTNEKSQSDPSRNPRTPFAVCHFALDDALDQGRTSHFSTVQVHSYDTDTHPALPDIQVSAFRDDMSPNPPMRDLASHLDLIHFLGRFPLTSLNGDPSINRRIDQYVGMWCSPTYSYYMERDSIIIPVIADLTGSPTNQEAIYSHQSHDPYIDPENFIHMEMDEYPDALVQPADWHAWLPGAMPPTMETFQNVIAYYMPYINALDSAFMYSHILPDTTAPAMVHPIQANDLGGGELFIQWAPQATDRFFSTYQIFYDTANVTWNSPSFSRTSRDLQYLQDFQTSEARLKGLPLPLPRYHFAIGANDIWGHRTLSEVFSFTNTPVRELTSHYVYPDSLELRWEKQTGDSLYLIYSSVADTTDFKFCMQTDTNVVRVSVLENSSSFYQIWKLLKIR